MAKQLHFLDDMKQSSTPAIAGLTYIADYISQAEQDRLITSIDRQPWLHDLKRRVQHYGYKYDYKARNIDQNAYLGQLPDFLTPLCRKLVADRLFATPPDQVIVNEYEPGQGISAHIDCTPCFKDIIVSLSLGSSCVMQLSNPETGERIPVFLEERSLIILSDDARYKWLHAIPPRKSDTLDGQRIMRGRRISLTFRNVITEKSYRP